MRPHLLQGLRSNTKLGTSTLNTKELFTSWTMKSSQVPVKYMIGCWIRPETTLVYTNEKKMSKWPCSSRSPKIHILKPTLSTNMVQRVLLWERQTRCSSRKRQGSMTKECYHNNLLMNSFSRGREDEDKRRQENDQTWFFFPSKLSYFGHILKKQMSTFTFWCMVNPLSPHLVYT